MQSTLNNASATGFRPKVGRPPRFDTAPPPVIAPPRQRSLREGMRPLLRRDIPKTLRKEVDLKLAGTAFAVIILCSGIMGALLPSSIKAANPTESPRAKTTPIITEKTVAFNKNSFFSGTLAQLPEKEELHSYEMAQRPELTGLTPSQPKLDSSDRKRLLSILRKN